MSSKLTILTFAAIFTIGYGFTIRDIWDYLLGAGYQYPYGHRPGYPSGPGLYPGGNYHGQYGGQYGNYHPGLEGPPGAHPGCPLCDSSVYSYCSHKQAHDACCCENSAYLSFSCRTNCKSIYANSCEEYHLITNCCCVDLQKNAIAPPIIAAPVV